MYSPSLQHYPYLNLFERCQRSRSFYELESLISKTFSTPQILNDSFKLNTYRAGQPNEHNIDFTFIMRFFNDRAANATGQGSSLLTCLDAFFRAVDEQPTDRSNYMRAYLILLMNPQLHQQEGLEMLARLSIVLHSLPEERRRTFVSWLQDIDPERFAAMVAGSHGLLCRYVKKLLPGPDFEKVDTKGVTTQILASCRLLEMLHTSNQTKYRINSDLFRNSAIMEYFDPAEQFKLNYKNIRILNFMDFPFLLNLDYKIKLLEIETRVEHQINMQKGLMAMLNGVMPEENPNGNPAVINALFLMIQVHRNNILDDSLDKLSKTNVSLKNPLKITFVGEPGDDGGGVKKEYFQLLIKEIFHPHRDMFLPRHNNSFYWFNGQSFQAPLMFELVGMILGLSIYNTTLLDLKFPNILYKKLLAPEGATFCSLDDLSEIQPDFERSFRYLLETQEPLQPMEMTFEAQTELYGEKISHQLKPYGNLIKVSQSNKDQYVRLYTDWLINKSIEKQYRAFRKGFFKVVTGEVIKLFSPVELERVICGAQTLDFKDLEKAAKYEGGYSASTLVVKWLWEIVEAYDHDKKKSFLFFVTGTDRAPIMGLSSCKFVVERHCADSDMLPTSRTCSSVLLLPEYSSKAKLQLKLELALQHKEGFGLI